MYYKIIVEGNNFLVSHESNYKVVGFFTTFFVEAKSTECVNESLIYLLKKRLEIDSIKSKKTFFTESYVLIEAVYPAVEDEYKSVKGGFTLYNLSLFGRLKCYFKFFYLKMMTPERLLEMKK